MPVLVRLYIRQCLIGFALAGIFVALLLGLDVAGLRGLVMATDGGFLAAFLLFFFNGLVFAGAQFAITIMQLRDDTDTGGKRGRAGRIGPAQPQPIPVQTRARG